MAAVHKITLSAMRIEAYMVTLLAMRIESIKAVITLSRWISSLQNLLLLLQETTKKLQIIPPGEAYLRQFYNQKSFFPSFNLLVFFSKFPLGLGGFLLINLFWQFIFGQYCKGL